METQTLETQQWCAKARSYATLIEAHRDEAERRREMPRPVFEALREAGFFRMWSPAWLGGPQVTVETMVAAAEELSRLDGGTGWNVVIGAQASGLAAFLPERAAREVFDSPQSVVSGSSQPTGKARRVDGGFRITGRWPMASGCTHATWMGANCLLPEDDPLGVADGRPDPQFFLVPISDCQIIDTWHVAGLLGTGSNDFEVDDVFVPEDRRVSLATSRSLYPGVYQGPSIRLLFRLPIAAVGLGIARDALDTFRDVGARRTSAFSQHSIAEQSEVPALFARTDAKLRAARAFFMEVVREVDSCCAAGIEPSDRLNALANLAGAHAAETASEVVGVAFRAGGSSSMYTSSRLQRCLRDVNMVTQHIATNLSNFDSSGRVLMAEGIDASS